MSARLYTPDNKHRLSVAARSVPFRTYHFLQEVSYLLYKDISYTNINSVCTIMQINWNDYTEQNLFFSAGRL